MSSRVIPGNGQTAYERWELPHVKTKEQEQQEEAGLLTAQQLENLQQQAYEEGLNQGKEEGYQQGFNQGVEEGHAQGLQAGQQEVEQHIRHLEQILKMIATPLEQVNQDVQRELLVLSMAIAKQIIRREMHIDSGQVVAVIKEAVAALPSGASNVRVYLHPEDAQLSRQNLSINDTGQEEYWVLVEDPSMSRGGCRVETDYSMIDASIEKRVAEIAAQILGNERNTADTTNVHFEKERQDSEAMGDEAINGELSANEAEPRPDA